MMQSRLFKVLVILILPLIVWGQEVVPDDIRVDYSANKKSLESVIVDLSEASEVNITFNPNDLPKDKLLSFNAQNKRVGTILNAILKGTETKYKIIGDQLVIYKDEFVTSDEILTISGYLTDSLSGEPLIFANIFNQQKQLGTNTNEYGFYSFSINKGVQRIYYSYLGYKKQIIEVKLKQDTTINVELSPEAVINEVLILDKQVDAQEVEPLSADVLPVDKIWSISSLAGESDIMGLAQLLSGVSTGADGLGGLNVRGGSFDQNLVLFDGVPVYNTSHALGIFSVFNPSTIKSAKLIKGSFPARYGGRLSSVFDVRTKDGSTKRLKGDVSLGLVALRGTLEGPLGKNGSSFLVSVRRTHLDLWLLDILQSINNANNTSNQNNSDYSFSDFNAKLNLKLGQKNKLLVSFYNGIDDLLNQNIEFRSILPDMPTETNERESEWGNQILSLRLNSELSQKLYHNLTVYTSRFRLNNFDLQQFETDSGGAPTRTFDANLFQSGIRDLGIKSDFDFVPNYKNYVKFGLGFVRHDFSPGLIQQNQNNSPITGAVDRDTLTDLLNNPELRGSEIYVYAEDEIRFSDKVKLNVGIRYNLVKTENDFDHSIEPRISLLAGGDNAYFKIGVSRMSQYLHLLSNGDFGIPSDVWVPSTDLLKPEKAWVANAGFGFNLSESLEAQIEGFYKTFDQIVAFSVDGIFTITEDLDWEATLPLGDGSAYGVEINLNKRYGKANILANYTWSRSLRQFEDINFNEEFAFRFDRTHMLKFAYLQKLNKNAEFSANWQINSGSPVSVPFEVRTIFDAENNPVPLPLIEGRNLQRLPIYHRLDLAFNIYNKYDWANQKFSIGAYNAYARNNPYFIDLGFDERIPGNFRTFQNSVIPFVTPYISYSLSF
jgi:outer membrane receptor for ferrienterochelin and colicin